MPRTAPAADALVGVEHVLSMHRRRPNQHDQQDETDDDDPGWKTTDDHHPALRCGSVGGADDLDRNVTADMIAAPALRRPL
jgi:hypothetical protein